MIKVVITIENYIDNYLSIYIQPAAIPNLNDPIKSKKSGIRIIPPFICVSKHQLGDIIYNNPKPSVICINFELLGYTQFIKHISKNCKFSIKLKVLIANFDVFTYLLGSRSIGCLIYEKRLNNGKDFLL